MACYTQYRHVLHTRLKSGDVSEAMRLFQFLTMVLMSLYHHSEVTKRASASALHDLLHVIICILLEPDVQVGSSKAVAFIQIFLISNFTGRVNVDSGVPKTDLNTLGSIEP